MKKGRFLCYDFVHGKCTKGDQCTRYHGPATPAMTLKRLQDEKKLAEKKATVLAARIEKAKGNPPAEGPEKTNKKQKGKQAEAAAETATSATG